MRSTLVSAHMGSESIGKSPSFRLESQIEMTPIALRFFFGGGIGFVLTKFGEKDSAHTLQAETFPPHSLSLSLSLLVAFFLILSE